MASTLYQDPIRLCFSVDYDMPTPANVTAENNNDHEYHYNVTDDCNVYRGYKSPGINRKRTAIGEPRPGFKRRNMRSPSNVKIEPRRSASAEVVQGAPPEATLPDLNRQAIHDWLNVQQQAHSVPTPSTSGLTTGLALFTPVSAAHIDAQLNQLPQPAPTPTPLSADAHYNAVADQMLNEFRMAGVPTELYTGKNSAKIANAVATMIAATVNYSRDIANQAAANNQYLVQENHMLRQQLAATDNALSKLQDDFNDFTSRAGQKNLRAELNKMDKKMDKIRQPDVTMETLSKQIKAFEQRLIRQERDISTFQVDCNKELDKVAAIRKDFNREVQAKKKERKSDLKELELRCNDLEEKFDAAKDDVEALAEAMRSGDLAVAMLRGEVDTLRRYVGKSEDGAEEKWRMQYERNGLLSAGLTEVKERCEWIEDL